MDKQLSSVSCAFLPGPNRTGSRESISQSVSLIPYLVGCGGRSSLYFVHRQRKQYPFLLLDEANVTRHQSNHYIRTLEVLLRLLPRHLPRFKHLIANIISRLLPPPTAIHSPRFLEKSCILIIFRAHSKVEREENSLNARIGRAQSSSPPNGGAHQSLTTAGRMGTHSRSWVKSQSAHGTGDGID